VQTAFQVCIFHQGDSFDEREVERFNDEENNLFADKHSKRWIDVKAEGLIRRITLTGVSGL
jgi:hypothetical protein